LSYAKKRGQSAKFTSEKKANFIEPTDCAPVTKLADGPGWLYEIKLDGYRAVAVKSDARVNLFSPRRKSFNFQHPHLVEALGDVPDGTVVDGEVVALDESGRPNFNLLAQFRRGASRIHYFIFDLLVCDDRDLTRLPLAKRRELMKSVLKLHSPRIRIAEQFEVPANDMLAAVRQQQLEGVIGKRKDSLYEPGKPTGSWIKCRVNRGQEFVIGGYIPGSHGFDSLIIWVLLRERFEVHRSRLNSSSRAAKRVMIWSAGIGGGSLVISVVTSRRAGAGATVAGGFVGWMGVPAGGGGSGPCCWAETGREKQKRAAKRIAKGVAVERRFFLCGKRTASIFFQPRS